MLAWNCDKLCVCSLLSASASSKAWSSNARATPSILSFCSSQSSGRNTPLGFAAIFFLAVVLLPCEFRDPTIHKLYADVVEPSNLFSVLLPCEFGDPTIHKLHADAVEPSNFSTSTSQSRIQVVSISGYGRNWAGTRAARLLRYAAYSNVR
jgi:hypothetical protein